MRVAAQAQAEMAEVVGGVDGLALGAQHDLVDEVCDRQRLGPLQHLVEIARAQRPGTRQLQAQAFQELPQRRELLLGGRIVDAEHDGCALGLERLAALGRHHAGDAALAVHDDLALGQVEVEGAALIARIRQRPVGCP